jgi:hypothetical protein
MTTDNDWLGPAWNEARNIRANNWLSEDSTVQNITNSSIWRLPHLFKLELNNTFLIRSNGSTLDANLVLLDCVGRLNGDLVIGGISVLNG